MNTKREKTIIIGVTGGLGTGKTTVAGILGTSGAKVLDADKIVHRNLKKGTVSYRKIVGIFGRRILSRSGGIDRGKLSHLVFKNKKSLNKLCSIVHPVVIDEINKSVKKILKSGRVPAVVIDAPLLIESGLHTITDYLIVVKTSRSTQIKRVVRKTGLTASEVVRRIKSQMPLNKKIEMADFVINNEGGKSNTRRIVKDIWKKIT
jgi:dephospho-CoA kinase